MIHYDDYIRLEFAEVIRINQLLHIYDFDSCRTWYDNLPQEEQCTLVAWLYIYGNESYPTIEDYQYALQITGVICSTELHRFAEAVTNREPGIDKWMVMLHQFPSWIKGVDDNERSQALALFFYIFCRSDEQRRKDCGSHCSHWWHQNLSDPAIVATLLQD